MVKILHKKIKTMCQKKPTHGLYPYLSQAVAVNKNYGSLNTPAELFIYTSVSGS